MPGMMPDKVLAVCRLRQRAKIARPCAPARSQTIAGRDVANAAPAKVTRALSASSTSSARCVGSPKSIKPSCSSPSANTATSARCPTPPERVSARYPTSSPPPARLSPPSSIASTYCERCNGVPPGRIDAPRAARSKQARQRTGRPSLGKNGTIVGLPHSAQMTLVSQRRRTFSSLALHFLQCLGSC